MKYAIGIITVFLNYFTNSIAQDYFGFDLAAKAVACKYNYNASEQIDWLDAHDEKYKAVRQTYQTAMENAKLDETMLNLMIKKRGASERVMFQADGDILAVPAGLNLGGHFMLELKTGVMFLHRIKLRNITHFLVNYLRNNASSMMLQAELSLNDLHLLGSYESMVKDGDEVNNPTYGSVEFLLRNVKYVLEGRYRIKVDRLYLEMVVSDVQVEQAIMIFKKSTDNCDTSNRVILEPDQITELVDRLKANLNEWIKDYFNDYLIYFEMNGTKANKDFQKYDAERTLQLNEYVERVLMSLKSKQKRLNLQEAELPNYYIKGDEFTELNLTNGVLRGLESFYRRSVVTNAKTSPQSRSVDALIGFGRIRVVYKYEARLRPNLPKLNGYFVLSADQLTAHMGIALRKDPKSATFTFDLIRQLKPESLVIEGPITKLVSNFRHFIDHHVLAIMVNEVFSIIKKMEELSECEPGLIDHDDPSSQKNGTINNDHKDSNQDDNNSTNVNNDEDKDYVNLIIEPSPNIAA